MRSHLNAIHKWRKPRKDEDHGDKVPLYNRASGKNATSHLYLQAALQSSRSISRDSDELDDHRMSAALTSAGVFREEYAATDGADVDREFALEREATSNTMSVNKANDDDLELAPEKGP